MALGKQADKEQDESPKDWARRRIVAAGYWCQEIVYIFPPGDTDETAEVFFWGRESDRIGAPAEKLTAYIRNNQNGEAMISPGW